MSTTAGLLTVEQFLELPDHPEDWRQELIDGEVVAVPPAKRRHFKLQRRLEKLHSPKAEGLGEVSIEVAYRINDDQMHVADVAFVSRELDARYANADYLGSAPEIVIEIISPSDTTRKLNQKRRAALAGGALEFWVVDPDLQEIEVSTPAGVRRYGRADSFAVGPLSGAALAVKDVFAE